MKHRLIAEILALSMMVAVCVPTAQITVQAQRNSETTELTDEELERGSYSDLQIALVHAEMAVQTAQSNVTSKKYELENAQKAAAKEQTAYDQAVTDAANAAANITKAQANVNTQEAAVDQAVADKAAADQKVADAEAAIPALEQAVVDAENELERVEAENKNAIDAAQAVIDQGSAGFFKEASVNDSYAAEAYNIITGTVDSKYKRSTYSGKDRSQEQKEMYERTDLGAEGDATSLENMRSAIALIKEANTTRQEQDGRGVYSISHILMAMGQLNANWCYLGGNSDGGAHSQVFNTAENIGIRSSVADMVDAWYDEEKEKLIEAGATKTDDSNNATGYVYTEEQQTKAGAGHFLNMVNKNYNIVGAGVADTEGTGYSGNRYSLEMTGNSLPLNYSVVGRMSIDSYEEMFISYYNKVYEALAEAKAPLAAPQATLDAARKELEVGEQAVIDAEKERTVVQQALNDANDSLDSAKRALVNVESAKDRADQNVTDKKAQLDTANGKVKAAEKELEEAEEDLADKEQALADAQAALDSYGRGDSGSGSGSGSGSSGGNTGGSGSAGGNTGSGSGSSSGNTGSGSGSGNTGSGSTGGNTGSGSGNTSSADSKYNGWKTENGKAYWYEYGVKQGTTGRGKEIYDPGTNAWYWLDAVQGGAKAVSKEVYQESNGGKWVRYDAKGHMIKGWYTNNNGTYYYNLITGAMTKGKTTIDGLPCWFDETTGIGKNLVWEQVNGQDYYWYESGKRQGYDPGDKSYRGKEIYDPAQNAWFWLDNNAMGKKAVSKDVYQPYTYQGKDTIGKWVRYDSTGRMIKGWNKTSKGTYYFDKTTGAMLKGRQTIDGRQYYFNEQTGILQ